MSARDTWAKLRSAFAGKYNDEKFWRVRHALCTGSVRGLRKAIYQIYFQKECRKNCADIMLGWDDERGCQRENFAAPPIITAHGINGIVIAGGRRLVAMSRYFTR